MCTSNSCRMDNLELPCVPTHTIMYDALPVASIISNIMTMFLCDVGRLPYELFRNESMDTSVKPESFLFYA